MRMLQDGGSQTTLWFMAIAADDNTQPCRQLSDCPRAVQRANSMFEEYATLGEALDTCLLSHLLVISHTHADYATTPYHAAVPLICCHVLDAIAVASSDHCPVLFVIRALLCRPTLLQPMVFDRVPSGCALPERTLCTVAVQVAVLSARKHSPNLLPILLHPGKGQNRLTQWLDAHGGLAFQHRSVLLPRWEVRTPSLPLTDARFRGRLVIASGHGSSWQSDRPALGVLELHLGAA